MFGQSDRANTAFQEKNLSTTIMVVEIFGKLQHEKVQVPSNIIQLKSGQTCTSESGGPNSKNKLFLLLGTTLSEAINVPTASTDKTTSAFIFVEYFC